ncbi:Hsp20/alpha crystallin family protein [Salinadaptatus halalkaliphilus]|uniref:Hsp20/alpha crystallin family protein n=1 Tax=Salinadaptatus halalkaliphilus TaxID=2419781 RepID=A0A4S3TMJ9_9EURY|nr:Hsp20/alpha crystallin family protein [Salinadaptatus halalkaliphilus]THE65484.1 Hsp20/alpha crystallin family protein [Salinadaptatus halalkaliphilus]
MSGLRDALGELSDDVFFDLLESEDAYLLVLDAPGVTADSLELSVADGTLSIEATRQKDRPDAYRYLEENRPMFVDVSLPLPEDAVAAETEAAVDRGVLEIELPKRSGTTETTIDVVERERASETADETGTTAADDAGDDDQPR